MGPFRIDDLAVKRYEDEDENTQGELVRRRKFDNDPNQPLIDQNVDVLALQDQYDDTLDSGSESELSKAGDETFRSYLYNYPPNPEQVRRQRERKPNICQRHAPRIAEEGGSQNRKSRSKRVR